MIYLNNDVCQIIFNFMQFKQKIQFRKVCNRFRKFHIFELLEDNFSRKVSQKILERDEYKFIHRLNIRFNKNNFDLNFLSQLKELNISDTQITDLNIKKLNLERLNVSACPNITNIKHMTKLKILYANSFSGINDSSLVSFNLEELCVTGNKSITNVNHMTKLKNYMLQAVESVIRV